MNGKPQPNEYASFFETYISLIGGNNIVSVLEAQRLQMLNFLGGRSERDGNFRYAPAKWTVKEVLGHVCDAERVFAYRALRFARGDETPLANFDQDIFSRGAHSGERTLISLTEEFDVVRASTLLLFQSLREEAWDLSGEASGNRVTVRALAYIIAGHELHHRQVLEERYFTAIPRA